MAKLPQEKNLAVDMEEMKKIDETEKDVDLEKENKTLKQKLEELLAKVATKTKENEIEVTELDSGTATVVVQIRLDVDSCTIAGKRWEFKAGQKVKVPVDVANVLREAHKL